MVTAIMHEANNSNLKSMNLNSADNYVDGTIFQFLEQRNENLLFVT